MPYAFCDNNHQVYWRNQRGVRLADMKCPDCGTALHRAAWDKDTSSYHAPTHKAFSKTAGRKFEKCAICGKRRTVPGGGLRVEVDTEYVYYDRGYHRKVVAAGGMVCWGHETAEQAARFIKNFEAIARGGAS